MTGKLLRLVDAMQQKVLLLRDARGVTIGRGMHSQAAAYADRLQLCVCKVKQGATFLPAPQRLVIDEGG